MNDDGFSPAQLAQLETMMRKAMREELADAGLRIDGEDHQEAAREDFRFIRRLRIGYDDAVKKIGNAVLISLIAIGVTIFGLGWWAWLGKNLLK